MTIEDASNTSGEHGVEHQVIPLMTITVDPRTWRPSYKCTELPVAFWQMMVDEIARQLEETRRITGALQMQEQLRQAAENARVAAQLLKR